jgi:drug/metabolite transporter (DMT)-like permease
MQQPSRQGRLWIATAALLWSSAGLFAKAPLFDGWPVADRGILLAFWRATFVTLALLPLARRPRWRPELPPLVIAYAGMNACYLSAVVLSTAANAIWLQSTSPFWVLLLSLLFFREPIMRRDLLPVAAAGAGVGLILWFELQGAAWTGVACGLASGLFFGAVICCLGRLSDENGPWLLALCNGSTAAAFLPWVATRGVWPTGWQLMALAGFGVFQMAIPYLCLLRGLRSVSSQEAAAISLIEPVLMPVWVFLVWGERPATWTIAGAACILIGLSIRYLFLEAWSSNSPTSALPTSASPTIASVDLATAAVPLDESN